MFNSLRMSIGLSFANILLIKRFINLKTTNFILITCKINLNNMKTFIMQ